MPATAATRGTFWRPEAVDTAQYPTRMARRRALEAAQVLDGWQPDPVLTPALLERVGEELLRLFDDPPRDAPVSADVPGRTPDGSPRPVADEASGSTGSVDDGGQSRRRRHRRRRRGRAHEPVADRASTPAPGWDVMATASRSGVVRQDDPVDDAAWFAGLKQMTRDDERAEHEAPAPRDRPQEAPRAEDAAGDEEPRPQARPDVGRIVPSPATTPGRSTWRRTAVALAALGVVTAGAVLALTSGDDGGTTTGGPAVTPQRAVVVALSLSDKAAAARREKPAADTGKAATKAAGTPRPQAQAGDVTGLSLLAAGAGTAQQVLVPSRLLLDVPGAGRVPLAQSLLGSPQAPGEAIADALEVTVDTTWTLDSDALAALVDRVGGVVVDVDADITAGSQVGAAVLIGAGPRQKLAGRQAAVFAQFLGADEPAAVRLARQEQVLRAVVTALPDDPATIRTILSELPGAPTGKALDAVTRVVSATRLATSKNALASVVLPVREIDAGGPVVAYGLDERAAARLVASRLAGARLPVASVGHVRVLVQNGVGTPGLGDTARTKLLAAGLRYVAGGNLPGFGQDETVVLLRDASATNRERGMAVARSLGLGESSLRISESAPTIADVVVILGADFPAA